MYRMRFLTTITPDGLYHVQNVVAGLSGQHHVHSAAGFKKWRRAGDDIVKTQGACTCGLSPGDMRDHNGKVFRNEEFA